MNTNKNIQPIRISEKIHLGLVIRAIWEMLIGLSLGIFPIVFSFKVVDYSKYILFGFSFLAFYMVYYAQNVYWRQVELWIDDEYFYINRGKKSDKIKITEIENLKHYRLGASFREHHIKIKFKKATKFGNVVFIKPIKTKTDSRIIESTIKSFIESKIKKNSG